MKTFSRTFDASFLNSVVNHECVRPQLGGEGDLDLTAIIADPANFALVTAGGGWLLLRHEPGIYELHSQCLPEARGRNFFEAGQEALDWFFASTDAVQIVTKVPVNNRPAAFGASHMGFRERFKRPNAWSGAGGSTSAISYQELDISDWAAKSREARRAGEWFHAHFEGYDLPPHPEDRVHDHYVGAAVLMARAGALKKSVAFYNRWARFVGYPLAAIISELPPVIDMSVPGHPVLVGIRGDEMEVLLCR